MRTLYWLIALSLGLVFSQPPAAVSQPANKQSPSTPINQESFAASDPYQEFKEALTDWEKNANRIMQNLGLTVSKISRKSILSMIYRKVGCARIPRNFNMLDEN